jgi:hypothetical protein
MHRVVRPWPSMPHCTLLRRVSLANMAHPGTKEFILAPGIKLMPGVTGYLETGVARKLRMRRARLESNQVLTIRLVLVVLWGRAAADPRRRLVERDNCLSDFYIELTCRNRRVCVGPEQEGRWSQVKVSRLSRQLAYPSRPCPTLLAKLSRRQNLHGSLLSRLFL